MTYRKLKTSISKN